jgi:hypothetical protein
LPLPFLPPLLLPPLLLVVVVVMLLLLQLPPLLLLLLQFPLQLLPPLLPLMVVGMLQLLMLLLVGMLQLLMLQLVGMLQMLVVVLVLVVPLLPPPPVVPYLTRGQSRSIGLAAWASFRALGARRQWERAGWVHAIVHLWGGGKRAKEENENRNDRIGRRFAEFQTPLDVAPQYIK